MGLVEGQGGRVYFRHSCTERVRRLQLWSSAAMSARARLGRAVADAMTCSGAERARGCEVRLGLPGLREFRP
eukprot:8359123-Alexandrium_andersonii.AAC.1